MRSLRASLRFFFGTLRDFVIQTVPFPVRRERRGFAFIVHPRDLGDVRRTTPFFNFFPKRVTEWILTWLWPVVVARIEGMRDREGRALPGWIIASPLPARQMMHARELARKRIVQAARLAERLGAKNVGLGGLSASVTRGGLDVAEALTSGVTTGRAYTTHNVVAYVLGAIRTFNLDPAGVLVAVVGAAGGVGSTSARLLAARGIRKFLLVDLARKLSGVTPLADELRREGRDVLVSSVIPDIRAADIIITATNAPEAVIHSRDLKPGAIVVDDAQPSDIAPEVLRDRRDVIVIEAGVIETSGIDYHFNFHLAARDHTYACLGEVMALAYLGWEDHYSLGGIEVAKIDTIAEVAAAIGFRLAPWQNFSRPIRAEDVETVRNILAGTRAASRPRRRPRERYAPAI